MLLGPCVFVLPSDCTRPVFFARCLDLAHAHTIAHALRQYFAARAFIADYWRCAWAPNDVDRRREAIGTGVHACTEFVDERTGVCTLCGARELSGSEAVQVLRTQTRGLAVEVIG